MKNCYALFIGTALLLGSSAQIQGQEWFPVGAQWHYEYKHIVYDGLLSQIRTETYRIVDDTIIMNKNCKKWMFIENGQAKGSPIFIHEAEGQVFRYFSEIQAFGLIYDFNLGQGEHYIGAMAYGGGDTLITARVHVDSTSTMTINQRERKVQFLNIQNREWYFAPPGNGKALEGIGCLSHFFPRSGLYHGPFTSLRCYEDSVLGLFWHKSLYTNQETDTVSCDSSWNIYLDPIDEVQRAQVHLIPNPARQRLRLLMEASGPPFVQLEVYDLRGRRQTGQVFVAPRREWEMSLAGWPPGLYVLEVRLLSGQRLRKKLLVQ